MTINRCIYTIRFQLLFLGLAAASPLAAQVLRSTASIAGQVRNEDGEPVAARLLAYARMAQSGHVEFSAACSTETDLKGNYHCDHLRAGRYLICASSASIPVVEVLEARGIGVSEANQHLPPAPVKETKLAPLYPLTFYPGTADLAQAEIVGLHDGQVETINLILRSVAGTAVTVLLPPGPIAPGLKILTSTAPPLPLNLPFTSDAVAGKYIFHDVPPGSYRIEADWSDGIAPHHAVKGVTVTSGLPIEVRPDELKTSEIVGAMALDGDQAAKFPSQITVERISDDSGWAITAKVSADGSFKLHALAQGEYLLHPSGGQASYVQSLAVQNRPVANASFKVFGDGRPVSLSVSLAKATGAIRGTIDHPERYALSEAGVILRSQTGHFETAGIAADGHFEFSSLAPGSYVLWAVSSLREAEYRETAFIKAHRADARGVDISDSNTAPVNIELPVAKVSQ